MRIGQDRSISRAAYRSILNGWRDPTRVGFSASYARLAPPIVHKSVVLRTVLLRFSAIFYIESA
jgi:hypothetical protein